MTALSAASMKFTILADGTPRATIDFDPKDADAAYKMCGKPGQPLAVAALVVGHAAVPGPAPKPVKEDPRGPLCMEAISLCNNDDFQAFVARNKMWKREPDAAKGYILTTCAISSRKDLDHDPAAGLAFQAMKRRYTDWLMEAQP